MIKEIIYDKVILFNAGAFTISFMDLEQTLKIILLLTSIIYTITRIYSEISKKGEKK